MAKYYNFEAYNEFIITRFTKSSKYYLKVFDKDTDEDEFLTIYEAMNVFPLYPRPICMQLKTKQYEIKLSTNNQLEKIKLDFADKLTEKIKEYASYTSDKTLLRKIKEYKKRTNTSKSSLPSTIRKFFHYEIKDRVGEIVGSKVTNAWVKMYEILTAYKLFGDSELIQTFHLCEHPGAFVLAIQEWVATNTTKKHKFIFQSLKPNNDTQIFKPDPKINKEFLDYGVDRGDVTKRKNIMYYRNKYKDIHYDLITSDCGLSFSDYYTKQEEGLYKIFFGALLCAIGLADKGTNYVFKLFSFDQIKTIEMLYICCMFFKSVDLCRLLTDKTVSGEIYVICCDFNFEGDFDSVFEKLLDYLDSDLNSSFIIDKFDSEFVENIKKYSDLLTMRRITNYNMVLFRRLNINYSKAIPYVQKVTDYYADYFLQYTGLNKLLEKKS